MKKRNMTSGNLKFDKSWTLFLDRDGVINTRIIDEYVLRWEQFQFLPGALEAFRCFASVFGKIVIVTNQQGIGRGYMTELHLAIIHSNMLDEIRRNGGRVDAVYFSPHIAENNHIDRKPNVGMALKAKKEFPGIDFKRSVMVGDSLSDMEFGHRLGMVKVLVSEDPLPAKNYPEMVDIRVRDLMQFSKQIQA